MRHRRGRARLSAPDAVRRGPYGVTGSGQPEDQPQDPVDDGGDQPGGRERQHPGGQDVLRHAPADRRERLVAPAPMIAEVMMCVVETGAWKTNAVA